MYLVPAPTFPGTPLLKSLWISKVIRDFLYANEWLVAGGPSILRMVLLVREPTKWLEDWTFQPLLLPYNIPRPSPIPLTSRQRERGWKISSVTQSQWFSPSCLCNKSSIKVLTKRAWGASWLMKTRRCYEGGKLGESTGALHPSPLTSLCASLPIGCSWVMSFHNKPAI